MRSEPELNVWVVCRSEGDQMKKALVVGLSSILLGSFCIGLSPAGAATSAPSPVASASPTATSGAQTLMRFVVTGCEGCTIGVQRGLLTNPPSAFLPATPNSWQGPAAIVHKGVASFKLPTAYTPGSSFTLSAPWEGNTDAMTNIVLGSGGRSGQILTTKQALARKKATACWPGTKKTIETFKVSVARRTLPAGQNNAPTVFAIAWASPTEDTVGVMQPTFHGMLGNQDMYFC